MTGSEQYINSSQVEKKKMPLTVRKILSGWHKRDVLGIEERSDQVAVGDDLGAAVDTGRCLQVVQRFRVHHRARTVAPHEEDPRE